ncbi:MAG: hypothetical protein R3E50_09170 [Halioglobus sp.]
MVSPGIRATINAALSRENETHQLFARLEKQLPQLQKKLLLPEQEPVTALLAFIVGYVQSVPSCLHLVTAVSKRLGFYAYAAPFLHLAEDYFLQPPEVLPQDGSLEALLDEAFLAHRLLEEVNDHHIRHLQRPLLPLDMTEANIIVHHLLGDEFATRLEQLVQFTAAQLLDREHIWQQVRALPGSLESLAPLLSSEQLTVSARKVRLRLVS